MTDKSIARPGEPMISCATCSKEVPLSAAIHPEGADYIEHFCGLECYQRFIAEAKQRHEGVQGSKP